MAIVFATCIELIYGSFIKASADTKTEIGSQSEDIRTNQENPNDKEDQARSDDTVVPTQYKYVGNTFSLKFHKPSCPYARVMRTSRAHFFAYRKMAIDSGYKPCKYCLPPWWTKVSAIILPSQAEHAAGEKVDREKENVSP